MSETITAPAPKWWEKYPSPKSEPEYAPKEIVAEALKSGKEPDFLVIDVRRDDFKGGKIKTALNIPAMSIYYSINDIYKLAELSGKSTIYVHCNKSTVGGRAWRVAGWLQDNASANGNKVKVYALKDGIVGFATGGKEFTDLLDEYDASVWEEK